MLRAGLHDEEGGLQKAGSAAEFIKFLDELLILYPQLLEPLNANFLIFSIICKGPADLEQRERNLIIKYLFHLI